MADVYLTISGGPPKQPPLPDDLFTSGPPQGVPDAPLPDDLFAAPPQEIPQQQTTLPPPEDPNWYTRAWDTAASYIPQSVQDAWKTVNEPLTTLPSRAAKSVSDWMESVPITQETGQGGIHDFLAHTNAQARGLLQGTTEGLGQMGDAFTSPLGIATFGSGAAEKFGATRGLQAVADLANSVGKTGGLAFGAHGAQTIANPRTSLSEKAMAVPELAGGATPFFHESMPVRKPSTVKPKIEPTAIKTASGETRITGAPKDVIDRVYGPEVAETTTELPKQSKNTAEPPKPTSKPLEPGSQEAKDLSDEIAAAHKKGYAVIDPKSPIAQSPIIKSKRVVGTLSDGSLVIDPNATGPVPPTAGAEQRGKPFDASTIKYPSGAAPITPPAPEGMQFVDPVTGEIRTPEQAKPGDIPLTPGQEPIPLVTEKPRSATKKMNLSSGQTAKPAPEDVVADFRKGLEEPVTQPTGRAAAPTVGKEVRLPAVLRNAKPNFGAQPIKFASDLDKAAYIIARNERRSKYDANYLKFVMDNTGLDEQGARALGRRVKAAVKAAAGDGYNEIEMPPTARKMIQEHAAESAAVPPEQRMQDLSNRVQAAADKNLSNEAKARELGNAVRESDKAIKAAPKEYKPGVIRKALQLQKAWITSLDLSAPGRQGKAFMLNSEWWSALNDMRKAWGSKAAADMIEQSIEEHPSGYFKHGEAEDGRPTKSFAEKVGLDLAHEEEIFSNTPIDNISKNIRKYGLIDKSSRAHTAFLNKLRSDTFARMMSEAKDAGLINNPDTELQFGKKYANFINDATGRGKLKGGIQLGEKLRIDANDIMFAPKNMAGQIRTWGHFLDLRNYGNADPVMRKQVLKSLFAVAALGSTASTLMDASGLGKTSYDPTSTEFLKMQFGRTRIDPHGGYQQFPVAAYRFLRGLATGTSGKTTDLDANKYGQMNRKDVAERYFTGRLSPVGRFIWDWSTNKMYSGMPFSYRQEMFQQVAPIAASDIFDVLRENPALAAAFAIPTELGLTNMSVYRDPKSGR